MNITHYILSKPDMQPHSLYIHIPFCRVHCTYCAFNVYTHRENVIPRYLMALHHELTWLARSAHEAHCNPPIHTIYLGGGTPSLLTVEQIGALLDHCRSTFAITANPEITLEVNPDDARTAADYAQIRATGVNRLSIGMQSSDPADLRRFARQHTPADVTRTVRAARQAGFDNLSLDLIYGAPYQTIDSWAVSLDAALALDPDHLSLYALQIEAGTALARQIARGHWPSPDDDLAADMYDLADRRLSQSGLAQYEISTWAKPGHECRHNLQYWHNAPYFGAGAGAHGCANGIRYTVRRDLDDYITQAITQNRASRYPLTDTADTAESLTIPQMMDETLITELRLTQTGLDRAAFVARFGIPVEVAYTEAFARVAVYNALDWSPDRIRLRSVARLVSNQILSHFIHEQPVDQRALIEH